MENIISLGFFIFYFLSFDVKSRVSNQTLLYIGAKHHLDASQIR